MAPKKRAIPNKWEEYERHLKKKEKETFLKKIFFYVDTLESQPMAFVPWWLLFIIKPIHHLVFGVGGIQTPDILFNHKRLYQLS